MRRTEAIKIVEAVLSAELACSKADFDGNGVTVRRAEIREGRFRFPIRAKSLQIVTMGRGVVAACSAERMEWAVRQLGGLTREQIFSAHTMAGIENYVSQDRQYLAGPDQKYVCASDDLKEFQIPPDVRIKICGREQVTSLYAYPYFKHALSFNPESARPDMLAAVAECGGNIVGVAGASADCETMWQIGVDVVPAYQGLGIGKALVGTLTKAVLNEGIVPYYSSAVSHLHSRRLALSLGYWPAWIQAYAREL